MVHLWYTFSKLAYVAQMCFRITKILIRARTHIYASLFLYIAMYVHLNRPIWGTLETTRRKHRRVRPFHRFSSCFRVWFAQHQETGKCYPETCCVVDLLPSWFQVSAESTCRTATFHTHHGRRIVEPSLGLRQGVPWNRFLIPPVSPLQFLPGRRGILIRMPSQRLSGHLMKKQTKR